MPQTATKPEAKTAPTQKNPATPSSGAKIMEGRHNRPRRHPGLGKESWTRPGRRKSPPETPETVAATNPIELPAKEASAEASAAVGTEELSQPAGATTDTAPDSQPSKNNHPQGPVAKTWDNPIPLLEPNPAFVRIRPKPRYDDGCLLHDECLTCPLPQCYMEPGNNMGKMSRLKVAMSVMHHARTKEQTDYQAAQALEITSQELRKLKKRYFSYFPEEEEGERRRLLALTTPEDLAAANARPAYQAYLPDDPERSKPADPERCIQQVHRNREHEDEPQGGGYYQCRRWRITGPGDNYCARHANLLANGHTPRGLERKHREPTVTPT